MAFTQGHQLSKGRRRRKLTDTDVKAIYRSRRFPGDLAVGYGVSVAAISQIKRGHTRQELTGAKPLVPYLRGVRLQLHLITQLDRAIKHLEEIGVLKPRL